MSRKQFEVFLKDLLRLGKVTKICITPPQVKIRVVFLNCDVQPLALEVYTFLEAVDGLFVVLRICIR